MIHYIKGIYSDVLTNSSGQVVSDSGWHSNMIVQSCSLLLAALMRRHEGMQGILYWAVGEGEDGWDTSETTASSNATKLKNEITRVALAEDQIVYLPIENEPPGTLSNRLEITLELKGEDLISNGSLALREFGLFGGDASDASDSGLMINYVIHPRIDLTPELTLMRKLRLTFSTGAIEEEEIVRFGATLPVKSIDGVGDEYASDLDEQDIQSLSDLVEIDPLSPVGNIPQVKLREFRAKARTVMHLRVNLTHFFPLAQWNISDLLTESPENLVNEIGSPDVTKEMAMHLQEQLAMLQIALDDTQLQSIKLNHLIEV